MFAYSQTYIIKKIINKMIDLCKRYELDFEDEFKYRKFK